MFSIINIKLYCGYRIIHLINLIKKYAEIKYFDFEKESKEYGKKLEYRISEPQYFSDVVRYLLLYIYGGCWFDLDCFFLKSMDSIFKNYSSDICTYQWQYQNHPNGAIFISLLPKSKTLRNNIEFIQNKNRGWGFQEANLTFDSELYMLVFPCSWFDPGWLSDHPFDLNCDNFFEKTDKEYDFDNFFQGSFCFHWHNRWNKNIEEIVLSYNW
jgi:hypothetical protein